MKQDTIAHILQTEGREIEMQIIENARRLLLPRRGQLVVNVWKLSMKWGFNLIWSEICYFLQHKRSS